MAASQAAPTPCNTPINPSKPPLPIRPPIDPTLEHIVSAFPIPDDLHLDLMRGMNLVPEGEPNPFAYSAATVLAAHPNYTHKDYTITGVDGNEIELSVFTPRVGSEPASKEEEDAKTEAGTTHGEAQERDPQAKPSSLPALYHIHGGGLVSGDRFSGVSETLSLLPPSTPTILISIAYRLAPETRAPGGAEDCYSGLRWVFANAGTLGVDVERVIVYGVSGGGALAASLCLMVRDRANTQSDGATDKRVMGNSPSKDEEKVTIRIKGLLLHTPMLDDRCTSTSDTQFHTNSPWSGTSNAQAWDLALGPGVRGTSAVTPYQAPARETQYTGLPPMYVDVAECEVFRDPAVRWASEVWKAGGTCELHVWPGVWHIFDMMDGSDLPSVVQSSVAAKKNWLGRMVGGR
ncbi:hypothetical protein IAQ61_007037 [Plenodomus lingam]|uniref:Alpha/beta hydrolase fold-3 domain-containing protein n=1 Tax=Leptosphaeria maculans (strain JN3 / isolate v23.1.3 / race Av1-4-5-6-7-8) TaxID=985895 RepID=E5AD96_LEPMJ|nr:hypothetical protein LEMA_P012350.1 [Plenodomus lingam JN3]KAH9869824.1 hypothetical protein IAQ61_007037 [Plenodomus lingam]CBY02448.1 hypothetical protein LEMA_P012350.1 [Plenodomus lingam JN3]